MLERACTDSAIRTGDPAAGSTNTDDVVPSFRPATALQTVPIKPSSLQCYVCKVDRLQAGHDSDNSHILGGIVRLLCRGHNRVGFVSDHLQLK